MTTKEIQEWLCLQGFLTAIDGQDGPSTKACLRRFQADNGIPITGTADETTKGALSLPRSMAVSVAGLPGKTLAEAMASLAAHHLRQSPREVGGNNRGPWVRLYMGGEGEKWAWCAGFVCTLLRQATEISGQTSPLVYTQSCDNLADQAIKAGLLVPCEKPQFMSPGSLFLLRGKLKGDWIHTGIVTAFHDDHYECIEGNGNDAGSREGDRVCKRTRAYRNVDFVKI